MAISIPAATHINVVATEFDYSQKSNLGTERTGSYLSQASMLVYDDILRFQNSTTNPTADISDFNYNEFEGNILWFMDELVGMESDWIKDASNDETTAYGYVQFTEDSVETAVNRYIGHLERFNERSLTRDWVPYSIKRGETLPIPEWLTTLKNSTKTHKEKLDALTYDEVLALAFVHLHSKKSKDSNFVLLAKGDIYASKELYKNNHHTNPDAATLARLEGFFPWRKQNKYKAALVTSPTSMKQVCPFGTKNKTVDDVINALSSKLIICSGDDLFWHFQNQTSNNSYSDVTVTGITQQVHSAGNTPYTNWHKNLNNPPSGSTLKAFKREVDSSGHTGYYFYRENGGAIWLQNLKNELNNHAADYNFDELCQTINSWPINNLHTYFLDWWIYDTADPDIYPGFNFLAPNAGVGATPSNPFPLSNGFSFKEYSIQPNGILVIGMSTQPTARGQLCTVFHEGGGHAMHANWGHGLRGGKELFLSPAQNAALLTLYQNYEAVENAKYQLIAGGSQAHLDRVFNNLPMSNIRVLGRYKDVYWIEDEFLARVYSMMACNKCITFEKDIWPIMVQVSPAIDPDIIDINIAKQIDLEMKDVMKLDQRTY